MQLGVTRHDRHILRLDMIRWGLVGAIALCGLLASVQTAAANPAREARRDLIRIRYEIERDLRARPEMVQAKQEWVDSRLEYAELRRSVVEHLLQDEVYLSIRAQLWKLEDQVKEIHNYYRNGNQPRQRLGKLAREMLDLQMELTEMELTALQQHQDVLDARQAYIDAGRRLLDMTRAIQDQIRNDPRYREALANLKRTRTATRVNAIGPHQVP